MEKLRIARCFSKLICKIFYTIVCNESINLFVKYFIIKFLYFSLSRKRQTASTSNPESQSASKHKTRLPAADDGSVEALLWLSLLYNFIPTEYASSIAFVDFTSPFCHTPSPQIMPSIPACRSIHRIRLPAIHYSFLLPQFQPQDERTTNPVRPHANVLRLPGY